MKTIPADRRDKAIDDFTARKVKALGHFCQSGVPKWKRTTEGMLCFKGLTISDLPPKLSRNIDKCFLQINRVTAGYALQTWEDYEKLTPEDLTKIEKLITDLI